MDKPIRKHFAAGDYLTRFPGGSSYELRIDCAHEKAGWLERKPGSTARAVFPGSAILFEDCYYEVIEIGHEQDLPGRVCYYLNRWEDHFPIRTQFRYTPEECLRLAQENKHESRAHSHSILLKCFLPLIGLLPADDQLKLNKEYGVSSLAMTFTGSLLILFPSGFATIFLMTSGIGSISLPGPAWIQPLYMVAPYFVLESMLRLYSCAKLEEPMGSLIVAGPLEAIRLLRRNFDPTYRSTRAAQSHLRKSSAALLLNSKDEVRRVTGTDYDIEITSQLPKPHWSPAAGIQFEGESYQCISSTSTNHRYYFRLRKIEQPIVFRTTYQYTPEEVQGLYREYLRKEKGVWVEPLAPFWGLLEAEDQEKLASIYNYDALKFTKWTVVALGLLSAANIVVSLLDFFGGIGKAVDGVLLIAGTYFLIESISRWKQYRLRRPSGSLIGKLFRPLIRGAIP